MVPCAAAARDIPRRWGKRPTCAAPGVVAPVSVAVPLMIVLFALFCCGMALWVVLADRNWHPPGQDADRLAGLTPDALAVIERANKLYG